MVFINFRAFGGGKICTAHQGSHDDSQKNNSWYWEIGQKELTARIVCWYLTLRAATRLQVGEQTAGYGGLKRCQFDLLYSCLTAPTATSWVHHHVQDARVLPGCPLPLLRWWRYRCSSIPAWWGTSPAGDWLKDFPTGLPKLSENGAGLPNHPFLPRHRSHVHPGLSVSLPAALPLCTFTGTSPNEALVHLFSYWCQS